MDRYSSVSYNTFFYSSLCHVCKSSCNIKRCSMCKTLAYCSKKHQAQDWKLHKKLCKAIVETDKSLSQDNTHGFADFKDFKVVVSVLWKNKLGRPLDFFEEQIWMFPRVCVVCFSKDVKTDCQDCLNVSYCSELHKNEFKEEHLKYCNALKLCMHIDLYYFRDKYRPTEINVKPFEDMVKVLPNSLEELMIMYGNSTPANILDEKIQFIIKANHVGPVATILYGLEKSALLIDRNFPKRTLTIHIVGADITEMRSLWKIITELPFHWIKNIDSLNIFVIGPELCHNGVTEIFAEQLCDHCKKKNPKTTITFHWKLYHEVVNSLPEPDIVVAFNSGLHEFHDGLENTWKDSIKDLTRYPGVPLLLTAYTLDEIKQDIDIVRQNDHVKTILEPQQNPFCNMTPLRNWEDQNVPIFYINSYMAILSI